MATIACYQYLYKGHICYYGFVLAKYLSHYIL